VRTPGAIQFARFGLLAIVATTAACISDDPTGPTVTVEPRAGASVRVPAGLTSASPWQSVSACAKALQRGDRLAPTRETLRRDGRARIASWNIRYFPDGVATGEPQNGEPTNVDWLACAIAWLDVDVLAVQEFKAHEAARAKTQQLLATLDALTGGQWEIALDECGDPGAVHVGLLWDRSAVDARAIGRVSELDPEGHVCHDEAHPGMAAYFRFPGGLDAHVVSTHSPAGKDAAAHAARQRVLHPGAVARARAAVVADPDVVLLGDFNTIGCEDCEPRITAEAELASMRAASAAQDPPFRWIRSSVPCTAYQWDAGVWLDHVVVSESMVEADAHAQTRVAGFCGEVGCRELKKDVIRGAYTMLSDHCPLVVDLRDRDDD
jgi:endonuclease/exonuclease/phosphatase family metal-dependent hydrolase